MTTVPTERSAPESELRPQRTIPRRTALAAGAGLSAGVASLLLPGAAAHASTSPSGGTATDWTFDRPVVAVASHVVGGSEGILVSSFSTKNEAGVPARLTRVLSETVIDAGFNTRADAALPSGIFVSSIAVQPDQRIIVGGGAFTEGVGSAVSVLRLAADGSVDPTFTGPTLAGVFFGEGPERMPGDFISVVAVRTGATATEDRILVGGSFLTATDAGGDPVACHGLVQLLPDGSLDPAFERTSWPGYSDDGFRFEITQLLVLPGGDIIVGGGFMVTAGSGDVPPPSLFRLDGATGAISGTFSYPNFEGISALARLSDGDLLVADYGSRILQVDSDNGAVLSTLLTLSTPGEFDLPNARSIVADGPMAAIVGGFFTSIGGVAQNALARITVTAGADGADATAAVDTAFAPRIVLNEGFVPEDVGSVNSIARRIAGGLAIGGYFDEVDDQERFNLALLKADGTLAV